MVDDPLRRGAENSRFVTTLFLIVFSAALLLLLRLLFVYVTAIVLALVLCSLFWGVHTRLIARLGGRKALAAALSTALVALVVLVPLVFLITSMSAQAYALYVRASKEDALFSQMRAVLEGKSPLLDRVRDVAARFGADLSPERLSELAAEAAKAVGLFFYEQLGGVAGSALSIVLHFGMMIVILYALFAEGERLRTYVLDLSPLPDEQEETIARRFASISRAVFVGNGLGSALQGFFGGLSFYLFGLGSGALWGAAIAFFAFLPLVGASVVVVPAAAYLVLTGRPGAAVGFLIFNAVQVFALEYVVKSRLIGGQGQMNGVLVFFGMVAGINVFGLLGLFYGPLVLTMFLTLAEIYREHYRDELLGVPSAPLAAEEHTPAPLEPDLPPEITGEDAVYEREAPVDEVS